MIIASFLDKFLKRGMQLVVEVVHTEEIIVAEEKGGLKNMSYVTMLTSMCSLIDLFIPQRVLLSILPS